MSRPLQFSDEDVLRAAHTVLEREGVERFSLAEVARAVGVTRAAIMLRFKSTRHLKLRTIEKGVKHFVAELQALEFSSGGDGLLAIADFIGSHFNVPSNLAGHLSQNCARLRDPDLMVLESKRGDALRDAIGRAMPCDIPGKAAAIEVFSTHLTGCLYAWAVEANRPAPDYLRCRSAMLLDVMGIQYSEHLAQPSEPALLAAS